MKKSPRLIPSLLELFLLMPICFQLIGAAVGYVTGMIFGATKWHGNGEIFIAAAVALCVVIVGYVCSRMGRRHVRKAYGLTAVASDGAAAGTPQISCSFVTRYLGVVIACGYTLLMAVIAICLPVSDHGGVFSMFAVVFGVAHITSTFVVFIATIFAVPSPWPFLAPPFLIYVFYAAGMAWEFRARGVARANLRGAFFCACAVAVCAGVFLWRSDVIKDGLLGGMSGATRMDDTIYTWSYDPWRKDNKLAKVDASALTISDEHPRIDGATALYPVYAAAAQAIYANLDARGMQAVVGVSTTPNAYERLMDGRVDMIFCAQPSRAQIEAASAKGLEFKLTPLGREAFVFFVNEANPVDGLTTAQIKAIYRKDIVNWSEVGGRNKTILPFQRPKDSGSQTAMEMQVMRGESMGAPLKEEQQRGMGGIVRQTAAYRNADNAIGYSFRFFVTAMTGTKGIKLLKIDGVAPTVETIRDGTYPYTGNLYAVTTNKTADKPHVQELIAWFQRLQGQKLIEDAGYVSLGMK